jgi:phospholipid/cholesterol/gamma-HCH transport system substrate-binding protein
MRRTHPANVILAGLVFLAVLVAVALFVLGNGDGRKVVAYFNAAVGVYPNSDLRILGVRVGKVDKVEPQGRQVKVTMTVDGDAPVPAAANAVVVAPSVVADRYIQLTPPYTGGARLTDGAVIPAARTATPVELDQLYESISKFTRELGPEGVNKDGALSNALNTGAENLRGNGEALGDTIEQFGQFTKTLSNSRNDLFATLSNLQKFTAMLKANDTQVRQAERLLASVNSFLAEDRQQLGEALRRLGIALLEVQEFIRENRALLKTNVDRLAGITQVLVRQRRALAEIMDSVPLAADNVVRAYDPVSQTLVGRGNLNEISMPVRTGSTPDASAQLCTIAGVDCPGGEQRRKPPSIPLPLPEVG